MRQTRAQREAVVYNTATPRSKLIKWQPTEPRLKKVRGLGSVFFSLSLLFPQTTPLRHCVFVLDNGNAQLTSWRAYFSVFSLFVLSPSLSPLFLSF